MKTIIPVVTALTLIGTGCSVHISTGGGSTSSVQSYGPMNGSHTRSESGEISADLRTLIVENSFGPISIVGTDGPASSWEWRLTTRSATDASASTASELVSLRPEWDGSKGRISVQFADNHPGVSYTSELTLRVPREVAAELHSSYGEVNASNLKGELKVQNKNARTVARDVEAPVHISTQYGSIEVSNVGPSDLSTRNASISAKEIHGDLKAESQYGSIRAEDVHGGAQLTTRNASIELSRADSVNAHTEYGSISVSHISGDAKLETRNAAIRTQDIGGNVIAKTEYGSIDLESAGKEIAASSRNASVRIHALSDDLKSLRARTEYGKLEVQLPRSLDAAIVARTGRGTVDSDFPIYSKPNAEDIFQTLPEDKPRVDLQNGNGDIRVIKG